MKSSFLVVSLTSAALSFASCQTPTTGVAVNQKMYLYAGAALGVQQFELNPIDGSLTTKGEINIAGSSSSPMTLLAATPDAGMLYAVSPQLHSPYIYQIDAAGSLDNNNTSPLAGNWLATGLAITPNGKYLYTVNQSGTIGSSTVTGGLYAYQIQGTSLNLIGSPITLASGVVPHELAIHPSGAWLYMTTDSGQIIQYIINTDGSLAAPATYTAGRGATCPRFSADGKYLYVVNRTDATISAFQVESTGALNLIGGPTTLPDYAPEAIAIAPNGKTLYAAVQQTPYTNRFLRIYSINGDGSVAAAPPTSNVSFVNLDSTTIPQITLDPTGAYIYASTSHGIMMTEVDPQSGTRISDPALIAPTSDAINWITIVTK